MGPRNPNTTLVDSGLLGLGVICYLPFTTFSRTLPTRELLMRPVSGGYMSGRVGVRKGKSKIWTFQTLALPPHILLSLYSYRRR